MISMSLGIFDTTTAADHELPVLSDEALDVEMKELELEARRLAARRARLVAEKGRRGSFRDDGHATLAAWLRATGNWAPRRATGVNRLARLCCSMPSVGAALWSGRIGEDQADELARVFANPRCGHLLEQSIELLIDQAHRLSFHEFRICVRRWETLADAAGGTRRHGLNPR